jgi:hypothetical protein
MIRAAAKNWHFRTGCLDEAVDLVKRHHYSRRVPSNIQFVGTLHDCGGLFGDYGRAVAAVFFCFPPTRWSEPVLELSRLVRADQQVPLTQMVAFSCRRLKAMGHDLLVSFADKTQGHHGGIYQAASWNYAGARERCVDGLIVDGVFVAGRSCNSRWGTRSPAKVSAILGREVVPHYDEGKHLYWRALGSRGDAKAKRLGLADLPYPKPRLEAAE